MSTESAGGPESYNTPQANELLRLINVMVFDMEVVEACEMTSADTFEVLLETKNDGIGIELPSGSTRSAPISEELFYYVTPPPTDKAPENLDAEAEMAFSVNLTTGESEIGPHAQSALLRTIHSPHTPTVEREVHQQALRFLQSVHRLEPNSHEPAITDDQRKLLSKLAKLHLSDKSFAVQHTRFLAQPQMDDMLIVVETSSDLIDVRDADITLNLKDGGMVRYKNGVLIRARDKDASITTDEDIATALEYAKWYTQKFIPRNFVAPPTHGNSRKSAN